MDQVEAYANCEDNPDDWEDDVEDPPPGGEDGNPDPPKPDTTPTK